MGFRVEVKWGPDDQGKRLSSYANLTHETLESALQDAEMCLDIDPLATVKIKGGK